jgi:hypothetical protein
MAAALRILMPGNYTGKPLTLFRGAESSERHRCPGFSWSLKVAHARKFAERHIYRDEYVVETGDLFRTVAPPEAVLLADNLDIDRDHRFGGLVEVVVDPFRLNKVTLLETVGAHLLKYKRAAAAWSAPLKESTGHMAPQMIEKKIIITPV